MTIKSKVLNQYLESKKRSTYWFYTYLDMILSSGRNTNCFIFICMGMVLFTHPFSRYPYDIFHHLIAIDKYYGVVEIPKNREIWHFLWAKVFYFLRIENHEVFFRAKVIHVVQTWIGILSVYYFSNVVIRNTFISINRLMVKQLSCWSVVIWLSIFATYSMHYQLVWNMWYSVNYQITLPLFWLITAFSLVVIFEDTRPFKKVIFIFFILGLSRFIVQAHSMEFMYYLMYMLTLGLLYIDIILKRLKKYAVVFLLMISSIIFFLKSYQPETSKIFDYLSIEQMPGLYRVVRFHGTHLVDGINRAFASINELMALILCLSIISTLMIIWKRYFSRELHVNFRLLSFILVTSLFVTIPLFKLSAGFFAVLTNKYVVNRLYYSSSLFLLLPISIYCFNIYKKHSKFPYLMVNGAIAIALCSVLVGSKHLSTNHVYYRNVASIKDSFLKRKMGFHLSEENISVIEKEIETLEKNNITGKINYYYTRADVSFVLKYILRKDVYWEGRRKNPDYVKIYDDHSLKKSIPEKNLILFRPPQGLPDYEPYR